MMWLSHTGRNKQAIITKKGMLTFPPVHRTVFFSVRLRRHDIVFNEDNPPQVLYVTEKLRLSTINQIENAEQKLYIMYCTRICMLMLASYVNKILVTQPMWG